LAIQTHFEETLRQLDGGLVRKFAIELITSSTMKNVSDPIFDGVSCSKPRRGASTWKYASQPRWELYNEKCRVPTSACLHAAL